MLKLFEILIIRPEIAFLFGFVILILIVIALKIGSMDKKILESETKIKELENKFNEFESKILTTEEGDLDIIDKFLKQKNVDSILDTKKTDPIKADKIITGSKVSPLLDPRGGIKDE